MRLILAAGSTETALIDGISAAGASPELMAHTPSGDAEIVVYGAPIRSPVTPVSPTGCVTPAAVTRAVLDVRSVPAIVLDAGMMAETAAPTVDLDADPGADVRESVAVADADRLYERARAFGAALTDDAVMIGETIPGGTTTALGVLTALGEPAGVSSSMRSNPVDLKRRVVEEGIAASGIEPGDCAGSPIEAVELMGDPVQATVAGVASGALEAGIDVTLAGGTQQLAIAALVRHAGMDDGLSIATTAFVAADRGDDLRTAAERLDLALVVTDPGFDGGEHVAMARYCAGEVKEGVGMGGALSLVEPAERDAVRDRFVAVCDRLGVDEVTESTDEFGERSPEVT
ncbi:nicotinate mononucleotide-dependent phosphoribosyltransferase CobT [Halovivax gelatinilyticus]|uniref:nicotinate mononucleotide-dependent phosphoribosyltransferase CobT n=1 Tax=Halovivax gelatinilyticus TaxID=2961597 RepID=UPI0020CA8103|nr:TIGR00303 family protein [Halovivax gelatinilyticus]